MSARTRLRAATAGAWLVTRRRAVQDVGLLAGSAVLLLCTLVLTLAVPRLVERAADAALQETITVAGVDADLVAAVAPELLQGEDLADVGHDAAAWLATGFGDRIDDPVVTLRTGDLRVPTPAGDVAANLVHVTVPGQDAAPVRWVAGTEPAAVAPAAQGVFDPVDGRQTRTVQVGLSAAAADDLGLALDDGPVVLRHEQGGQRLDLMVTGLYEPADPAASLWLDSPGLLSVRAAPAGARTVMQVSAYVPAASVGDLVAAVGRRNVSVAARAAVRTDGMTVADAHALVQAVESLSARSGGVTTRLPGVVAAFDARMSAARAQASLVLAGVATAAALCLVLSASLLAGRRRDLVAAERARGASLVSVALRSLLETVPVVVLVGVLAAAAVGWWLPEQEGSVTLALAVAGVAAGAPAVLATLQAATAWNGRRVPADREERVAERARGHARRRVAEAVVVVLAVAAVVSVRGRGVVPLASGGIDPLLATAPALVAGASALVVVRLAPAVVRVAGRWAVRSRGLSAPLAAARAHAAATAVVPLLATTVAVALLVLSGTLVQTVRTGQQVAADELVGAPVRIDGPMATPAGQALLDTLADDPGVTAVAAGAQLSRRTFGERTGLKATLLVVDAAELATVRREMGLREVPGLAALGEPGTGGAVPALASPALLEVAALTGTEIDMTGVTGTIRLDLRGATDLPPDRGAPPLDARASLPVRSADDGIVVVDRDRLAAEPEQEVRVDRAWVAGPGAVEAVTAAAVGPVATSGLTVTTRDGWFLAWSQSPVPAAMTSLLLAAAGVLAVLAVLAVVLVVVATSRERGRTVSALRTLGMDLRTARRATLGELAPLVVGGLVGGCAIGLGLPALIGGSLGLRRLTGEPRGTSVELTWWPVAAAVAVLVLAVLVAVVVEQATRRRDSLGQVLRVGGP